MRAPNEPATYEAFQPALDGLLHTLYGDAKCTIAKPSDKRSRFSVTVTDPAATVDQLLARLG